MSGSGSCARWRSTDIGLLMAVALVALTACDGSSSGPRRRDAPVEITGRATGGPAGGGGYTLRTDFCECYRSTVLLRSSMRPSIEAVSCAGEYPLGSPTRDSQTLEVALWTPIWTASYTTTVHVDPHPGLELIARCQDE